MKITRLELKNIMCFDEFAVDLSEVTLVEGKNGLGKTTIAKAIDGALGGGNLRHLLKEGTEAGEIVLYLNDNSTLRQKINGNGKSTTFFKDGAGEEIKKPMSVINQLVGTRKYGRESFNPINPIDLLHSSDQTRIDILLDNMQLEISKEQIEKVSEGLDIPELAHINYKAHALDVIATVQRNVYDSRTGINRLLKQKQETKKDLEEVIGETALDVESLREKLESLEKKKAQINSSNNSYKAKITSDARDKVEAAKDAKATVKDNLTTEMNREIELIRSKYAKMIDAETSKYDAEIEQVKAIESQNLEKLYSKYTLNISEVESDINKISSDVENAVVIERKIKTIQEYSADIEKYAETAQLHSTALKALETLKSELQSKLPIPDLEIKEGKLYKAGIDINTLNTAEQLKLFVELASFNLNSFRFMWVDGVESLDKDNYRELIKIAKEKDIQLLVTRVSDSTELSVKGQLELV